MRKIVSLFVVFTVALSTVSGSFAQKRPLTTRSIRKDAAPMVNAKRTADVRTEFGWVSGMSNGSGVLVEWQMTSEKGNMGFNVFRIGRGGHVQVNSDLIFGSAARAGSVPQYGEKYSFYDRKGDLGSVYSIEANDLDGRKITSNSISPTYSKVVPVGEQPRSSGKSMLQSEALNVPKEVLSDIDAPSFAPDPITHQWVVSHPGVKIGVKKEGIYRVTNGDLQAAGFNTASDPDNWQLYVNGVQQAITIGPGASYIEFYGNGVDTPESDIQGYFLIVGDGPGKRIQNSVARPSRGTVLLPSYNQTFVFKQRNSYVNSIINGPAENYFGQVIGSTVVNINFDLTGIDFARLESTFDLKLQGFSIASHIVEVTLNGQALNGLESAGQFSFGGTQTIPTSLLRDTSLGQGSNVLSLRSAAPGSDFSLFDTLSVNFNRKYAAVGNTTLKAYSVNLKFAKLTGFASANTRIFDISHPDDPKLITNLPFQQQGSTFGVDLPAARGRFIFAVEDSAILPPVSITPNDGVLLGVNTQAADLIIISYKDFLTEAQTWADYRTSQGFRVKVVDVDKVFNEFGYGVLSSDSIEAFLNYAYNNWQAPQPKYVLLIGDASYNSRNYNNQGFFNYVPTRIVPTIFTETASDEALADFDDDGLAEMAIGRIPARQGSSVTNALSKVTHWESNLPADPLSRGILFASHWDNNTPGDPGDPETFFQEMSKRIRDELPPGTSSTMINSLPPTANADLLAAMNNGKYLVNYSGHGSLSAWVNSGFFASGSVSSLTNHDNEAVYTMLTCLNGYFIEPHPLAKSLAETLVDWNNGGAVAAWASTGETTADVQEVMARRFYNQVGQGNIQRLGDLIKDAKGTVVGGNDVRLSWALLGDPTLKMR